MNPFLDFVIRAVLLVPALLIAIPVHEMGHAAAAYLLGDRSVRYFGYFKPDPRRFLEPLGAITVFVALVGWGRKVPVQPNRITTTGQKVIYENRVAPEPATRRARRARTTRRTTRRDRKIPID